MKEGAAREGKEGRAGVVPRGPVLGHIRYARDVKTIGSRRLESRGWSKREVLTEDGAAREGKESRTL
jgi:hypothetical protein